jgi:cob(I)alamin adenosyltransferase
VAHPELTASVVTLNRIYTRTGDAGRTRLANGKEVSKADLRVEAYGAVDETNACLGLARLHTAGSGDFDAMLARLQNELFDVGADLSTPPKRGETEGAVLRISETQVARLEGEIDALNGALPELKSFVLPGGTPAAAALHLTRTVCRRAERATVRLMEAGEPVSGPALRYLNRLSDLLFVAARFANDRGAAEVFWKSGATR